MKALSTIRSAINQSSTLGILALVVLTPVFYPEFALAAELQTLGQQPAVVFQIKNPDSLNNNSLSIQDITANDPLVMNLKQYLDDHDSPLGQYAEQIVQQADWQKALAISYVESHMGRYCFNNNCSGMGGAPGTPTWRKYPDKLAWFVDLSQLLQKPLYKDKYNTCKKMRGVYVQPGSDNWVYGCEKKYQELIALTNQSEQQRRQMAIDAQQTLLAEAQ